MKKLGLMTIIMFSVSCIGLSAQGQTVDLKKFPVAVDSPKTAKKEGLEVKPVAINFSLSKGESAYQSIFVTNNFATTMQFQARFSDWMRDSIGGHEYSEPGTIPRSCAQWMTFGNDVIILNPGETKDILVKIQLPDNDSAVAEMRWCLVFLESLLENKALPPTDSSRAVVNTIFRVGIHILQTPPSLQSQKSLEMLSFKSVKGEKNKYEMLCLNNGQTQLECKSYIELSNLETGKKISVEPIMFPIFPDQKRYVQFDLPTDIEKGRYSILAVADAMEDDVPLQASEAIIEIK